MNDFVIFLYQVAGIMIMRMGIVYACVCDAYDFNGAYNGWSLVRQVSRLIRQFQSGEYLIFSYIRQLLASQRNGIEPTAFDVPAQGLH